MADQTNLNETKSRAKAIIIFAVLLVLISSWAFLEPRIRSTPIGAAILDVLERPVLVIGDLAITILFLIKAAAFFIFLGLLASRARLIVEAVLARNSGIEAGQRYAVAKAAAYAVTVLGGIIGLQSAGINLNSLAVVGGALGLGIGLGLQESANNFLSGIILLIERPIKVGDRVEVGSLDGDVIQIGSRATWVRTNANITVIVPNSEFIVRQVINWTAVNRQVRFSVPVGVSYKARPAEVREALLAVASRDPDVLASPTPDVLFKGFGDSALNFELRVWTETRTRTPQILRSSLYFEIFEELGRRGIEIPFPQRDLHLKSSDITLATTSS